MKNIDFIIQPAKTKNLPGIFRLLRSPSLAPPNRPRAEQQWVKDLLRERQIVLVAEVHDQIVGFIMGETITSKVAISHLLAVAPQWRRHGIGHKLQQHFEREAFRRGTRCVLSYAVTRSPAAERLLRTSGYGAGSLVREYQKFL